MKKVFVVLSLALFAILSSCSDDDVNGAEIMDNGLSRDINNLVPEEILEKMKSLGLPIYTGDNPPNIEYSFYCDPLILTNSNLEDDEIGQEFAPLSIKFYDQDDKNLTLKCYYEQAGSIAEGFGGFIVGDGDKFSIFLDLKSKDQNDVTISVVEVISGQITDSGIKDFYLSIFMIDDSGDPYDNLIPIGGGRVIYDSDGFSEIIPEIGLNGIIRKLDENTRDFLNNSDKLSK